MHFARVLSSQMFRRLDADMDGVLSKRELGAYLELTEGLAAHGGDLADPVFRWLLGTFGRATGTPPGNGAAAAATTTAGAATTDAPGEGPGERLVEGSGGASGEAPGGAARGRAVGEEGLDEAGFRRCYRYLFASSGGDGEAVWRDLRAMGYRVIGGEAGNFRRRRCGYGSGVPAACLLSHTNSLPA